MTNYKNILHSRTIPFPYKMDPYIPQSFFPVIFRCVFLVKLKTNVISRVVEVGLNFILLQFKKHRINFLVTDRKRPLLYNFFRVSQMITSMKLEQFDADKFTYSILLAVNRSGHNCSAI